MEITITLTKAQEAMINEMVESGRYLDPSDVIRDALRALEERDFVPSPELEAEILKGVRSQHYPVTEETYDEIRRRARAMKRTIH